MQTHHQFHKLFLTAMAISFLVITAAYADTTYNDGGIHNIDTITPEGTVYLGNGTTVNVLSGGTIAAGTGEFDKGIASLGNSTVKIYGTDFNYVYRSISDISGRENK